MPLRPIKMERFIKKHGFVQVKGGKGGHRRYYNPKTNRMTEIPFHSGELSKMIELKILKETGLEEEWNRG